MIPGGRARPISAAGTPGLILCVLESRRRPITLLQTFKRRPATALGWPLDQINTFFEQLIVKDGPGWTTLALLTGPQHCVGVLDDAEEYEHGRPDRGSGRP